MLVGLDFLQSNVLAQEGFDKDGILIVNRHTAQVPHLLNYDNSALIFSKAQSNQKNEFFDSLRW